MICMSPGLKCYLLDLVAESQKGIQLTIVEVVSESHHVHRHSTAIGTMENPLLCEFGVKGNLP